MGTKSESRRPRNNSDIAEGEEMYLLNAAIR